MIFENAGVDYLIEYPFYQEIADMEPEAYIKEVLVDRIHAKCIVAGDDVSYGKRGAGDCTLLQAKAAEYGYDVIIIDKVLYEGREVSSTYVREEVRSLPGTVTSMSRVWRSTRRAPTSPMISAPLSPKTSP